ncbi:MAG: hypothetical protein Q8R57_09655 [Bacteroidota bacterium]|nr:hypothetical protein [Bacteroidota bacterium]
MYLDCQDSEKSNVFFIVRDIMSDTRDTDPEDRILGSSSLPASQSSNDDALGIERDGDDPLNVVVSGWQIYNNKGKVVEKYEPFFATGFDFELPE